MSLNKRQQATCKREIIPHCISCLLPLAFCLFSLLCNSLSAQQPRTEVELDNALMTSGNWFNDLDKAGKNPDKVLYLDLALKKLKTFPREILAFKNVERLYLPYNYWTSVPEEIGTLSKLKILDLSGNYYLNYLPKDGLSKLPKLEQLILKDNKLAAGEIDRIRKALPKTKVVME